MNLLKIETKSIILFIAILLSGLLAGIFFTWTNAITPGIGKLDDLAYLQVFQHMNRAILNPLFFIIFMGALLFSVASTYYYKLDSKLIFRMLIIATVIYFIGVFIVTIIGNLPLNDLIDKSVLESLSKTEIIELREKYEIKWNKLHLIRTITSTSAFFILIAVSIINNKTIKTI